MVPGHHHGNCSRRGSSLAGSIYHGELIASDIYMNATAIIIVTYTHIQARPRHTHTRTHSQTHTQTYTQTRAEQLIKFKSKSRCNRMRYANRKGCD